MHRQAWLGLFAVALAGPAAAAPAPFADAVVAWEMEGDALPAGVTRRGEVQLGGKVDGRAGVARFAAGSLELARAPLPAETKTLSMALRVRLDPAGWRGSLLSHRAAGEKAPAFQLAATSTHLRWTMQPRGSKEPLSLEVPLEAIGRIGWHDIVVRYDRVRVDLFVDGVWVDDDFAALPLGELKLPAGTLRLGDGDPVRSFRGAVDHLALWLRPLTDEEIATMAGGAERVAAATAAVHARLYGAVDRPLQYWKPGAANVGDAFPFFDGKTFHFLYLRDKRHHGSRNGLGAHQWAHAVSTDLVHWKHLPYAVPLTEEREASICTGSMFRHEDTYYAFYATRLGDSSERVDVAVSRDGVTFQKKPLSLAPPAGFKKSFRDPNVVVDPKTGLFHMWITAEQPDVGGTLVRLTSKDLETWSPSESLVTGGPPPECPDHFAWKGRNYLVWSRDLRARYRIGEQQFGPWRTPDEEGLGDDALKVMKTAGWNGDRRIGVGWLKDGRWGGRAVFREVVQQPDGTLGTTFVPEMVPATGPRSSPRARSRRDGLLLAGVPPDARVRLRVEPSPDETVLWLRAGTDDATGVPLVLDPRASTVRLGDRVMSRVSGLDRGYSLDIVQTGDIVDVSVDGRRTIIIENDEHTGTNLALLSNDGRSRFTAIDVRALR